jgi:hypothetical protein
MPAFRQEFGEAVRKAMIRGGRELSTREVSKLTEGKVSPTTVLNMQDGRVVGPELIVEFARALKVDPDTLLRLAGYEQLRAAPAEDEETENGADILLEGLRALQVEFKRPVGVPQFRGGAAALTAEEAREVLEDLRARLEAGEL